MINQFTMGYQPTFKGLMRIDIAITCAVTSIAFIFLLTSMDLYHASITCIMGALIILTIGIINIPLLGYLSVSAPYGQMAGNQKLFRYGVSYLISPLIYLVFFVVFEISIRNQSLNALPPSITLIILLSSWLINTLIIASYHFSYLHNSKIHWEIENLKLKATASEASNQLLKQQIHPHFLFNVLTTVKTLYKQDLNQGEEYLLHLANFLRASLSNPTVRIVPLESELQLCQDFIEMQRIRFGVALTYQVDLPGEVRAKKFVPYFAIQTLLENAIKHNDLTEEFPLHVIVSTNGNVVKVTNNFQPSSFKEPSTGQGLANLAKRYRLLTGEDISVRQDKNEFTVEIKLLDNEDSYH